MVVFYILVHFRLIILPIKYFLKIEIILLLHIFNTFAILHFIHIIYFIIIKPITILHLTFTITQLPIIISHTLLLLMTNYILLLLMTNYILLLISDFIIFLMTKFISLNPILKFILIFIIQCGMSHLNTSLLFTDIIRYKRLIHPLLLLFQILLQFVELLVFFALFPPFLNIVTNIFPLIFTVLLSITILT